MTKGYGKFVDIAGNTSKEEKEINEKAIMLYEAMHETAENMWMKDLQKLIIQGRKYDTDTEILNYILSIL